MAVWAWTIRDVSGDRFWNTYRGWGVRGFASVFPIDEQRTYPLPEGGEWYRMKFSTGHQGSKAHKAQRPVPVQKPRTGPCPTCGCSSRGEHGDS